MAPILAAYGLSGCDVVCSYCGTGKNIVINVLNKKNIDLSSLGFLHQLLDNYLKQGNCLFVCLFVFSHFFGQSQVETLNDAQKKM